MPAAELEKEERAMKTTAEAVKQHKRTVSLSRQDLFNRAAESARQAYRDTEVDQFCECGETVSYENWRRHLNHRLAQ